MLSWGYPEEQHTPGPIDRSETRLLMVCYFILTISCDLISYYEIFKHLYHNTRKNRSFSAFTAISLTLENSKKVQTEPIKLEIVARSRLKGVLKPKNG